MLALTLSLMLSTPMATGIHYDVHVMLRPEDRAMDVQVTIDLPAGLIELTEMPFTLNEQMGVPQLKLNGKTVSPARTEEREATRGKAIIRYIPIDPEEHNRIEATYTTVKSTGFVYKLGKKASYASSSNTFWIPSTGGRVISSDMTFDVPKGQVVKATGKLVEKIESDERSVYKFHSDAAATLSFASGPYLVFRDDSGDLPVALYLFKDRDWTDKAVSKMRIVADTLANWFGPYPFDEMAMVEVERDAGIVAGFGGASLEGFLLTVPSFIDGDDDGPNLAFIGHELGHSWWGHQIKSVSGSAPYMLSEALAQFGSLKAVEAIDGEEAAREYRTTGYPGYISVQSGKGALTTMKNGFDPPLGHLPSDSKSHGFSDGKGFQIYHQLEQVIGTKNLQAVFTALQRDNAWKRIRIEDFYEAVEKQTGNDLDWFFQQWFEQPGAPKWNVEWKQQKGQLTVNVMQDEKHYRFVTELEATFDDGTKKRWKVDIRSQNQELEFEIGQKVAKVVLDPDWDVFHWDPDLIDLDDKRREAG